GSRKKQKKAQESAGSPSPDLVSAPQGTLPQWQPSTRPLLVRALTYSIRPGIAQVRCTGVPIGAEALCCRVGRRGKLPKGGCRGKGMSDTHMLLTRIATLRQRLEQAQEQDRNVATLTEESCRAPVRALERQVTRGGQQNFLVDSALKQLADHISPV